MADSGNGAAAPSVNGRAYTIVDVNGPVSDETCEKIRAIDGVLTLRNLGKPVT